MRLSRVMAHMIVLIGGSMFFFISISLKKIKIEIFYDIFIDIFYGNDDNIFIATRNSVVNE